MESLSHSKDKLEENLTPNSEGVTNESKTASAVSLPSTLCGSNCNVNCRKPFSNHEVDKKSFDPLGEGFFPSKQLSDAVKSHDLNSTETVSQNNASSKADPQKRIYSNNSVSKTDETSANLPNKLNCNSCGKDTSVIPDKNLKNNLGKTSIEDENRIPGATSAEKDAESSQTHYSYLSICLTNSCNSTRTPSGSREPLARRNIPTSRYPDEAPLRDLNRPISQSRPSSPPPATYFPSARRPSLSLPPSPQSSRVHRASLPANAFASFNVSMLRPGPSSTHSSPSNSRARTPTPPPINRRSPRRRSARTPSPRPPLPPQATNGPPAQPQQPPPNRNRQECQPYKMKMRSR